MFDRGVTARYLAEPFISFDGPRLVTDVKPIMDKRDFDVVGVRQDGVIAGFVAREDLLAGTLDEHVKTFDTADVLDKATSLLAVLQRLVESPRVWLTILGEKQGIITK